MRSDNSLKEARGIKAGEFLKKSYGLFQTLAVFLLMVIILSVFLPRFLSILNILNLIKQLTVSLIVAAGMTIIILTGEFDISVGSVVGLTAVIVAKFYHILGIGPGLIFGILTGLAFGLLNGLIVTKGKIPSFITTLGTLMIARSLAFVISDGKVIADLPPSFKVLGQGDVGGIPYTVFFVIAVYGLGALFMSRTGFGRKVYAVGANRQAAMLSGINADRIKIISFIIVAILASLGGILLLSRMGAIQPYTATGLEFDVIAAVVIGGTSLSGGEGNILQTIIGVFIIGLIRNALNLSQINIFWQDFATGTIIIVAVLLDSFRRRITQRFN
ncbi:MAG: ABC transporter permease [Spirochaetales bacterium]|nr:MAG: ABC transporter permease [Spirochaetales bacterium]